MIDFRYHIVSLISVFLALAVGIILGAGPLEGSIGEQLTGQVDVLRTEKDELRVELDASHADLVASDAYVSASASTILSGTLTDRRVAVVQLGPVDDETYAAIEKQIKAAGATVSTRAQLASSWTAQDQADSRQSYAATLGDYLPEDADADGFDVTLARALVETLTGSDAAKPDAFSADATLIREILTSSELIDVIGDVSGPADVIVLLDSNASPVDGEDVPTSEDLEAAATIELTLAEAAQDGSEGAVVAGTSLSEGDLVSRVREDQARAGSISTVTDIDRIVGQVNLPLALAARVDGEVGHFGADENATALVPPAVTLAPVDRTPEETPAPDGTVQAPDAG
ncbi:copper transporter [Sanguibacter antarcticus]|uniref:Copper transport outer membrane protein MctB n=1 Tax=Sanguibacter antarcticus TaxID=372484 RepID=A0A2A9E3K6_9MICO|nr:copper transporter [Sanguibacter antarcticus]PFG33403.1 copper transport outer membrane protein MctB [Sanguibacter antarcticus]